MAEHDTRTLEQRMHEIAVVLMPHFGITEPLVFLKDDPDAPNRDYVWLNVSYQGKTPSRVGIDLPAEGGELVAFVAEELYLAARPEIKSAIGKMKGKTFLSADDRTALGSLAELRNAGEVVNHAYLTVSAVIGAYASLIYTQEYGTPASFPPLVGTLSVVSSPDSGIELDDNPFLSQAQRLYDREGVDGFSLLVYASLGDAKRMVDIVEG